MSLLQAKITTVRRCDRRDEPEEITLQAALNYIKTSENNQANIQRIRSIQNEEEQKAAKRTLLEGFVFTGLFMPNVSLAKKTFLSSSGLFCVDIDHIANAEASKVIIVKMPHVVACFISPRGNGLKVIIHINKDKIKSDADIKTLWPAIRDLFDEQGFTIDESRKDISGLCFSSYDPDIYINESAELFDPIIEEPIQQPQQNKQSQKKQDNRCLNTVIKLLQTAIPGTRHEARLKAGRLAGGYIAGGMIDEGEIRASLAQASDRIADKGITSPEENKTLEQAIEYGKLTPIRDYEETQKHLIKWDSPTFKIITTKTIKPFPGVMSAVVSQVLHIANRPQPELTILSALIGMAASIGGNYKLPGGTRLNLYGVGISSTGTGKDKAMLAGTSIALMAGTETSGQPGSGAGLEDLLSEHNTKLLLEIDEAAHFIAAMNDQKQTHMASLSGNLLKLFSASHSKYITRKLANSSGNTQRTCINPCVSLLGFACPDKLGSAFGGSGNIDDGLLGRILFASGRDNVKPLREKKTELHFHHEITEFSRKIKTANDITIQFSEEADRRLDVLIDKFDNASVSSTNPFARNLKARSFEKCERIAGVLAVWSDSDKPVIAIEHVNWAEAFINYSDDEILKFTANHLHGGQVQANASHILTIVEKFRRGEIKHDNTKHEIIIKTGAIPRSFVLRASKLSKKEFDEAIDHLSDLEKVIQTTKEYPVGHFKVLFFN